jgi:hypothetical protein
MTSLSYPNLLHDMPQKRYVFFFSSSSFFSSSCRKEHTGKAGKPEGLPAHKDFTGNDEEDNLL